MSEVSNTPTRRELERGQRLLETSIGARIVDAVAIQGAVRIEIAHRGTDDDCFSLVVPLTSIHFWDEEEPA